jgi:very-short-patch-repair endonuclease
MASSVARGLRRNPTEAERHLWSRLRRRQLDGFRFRRQVPLGQYVADFACLSARLIIEVDGGPHDWGSKADATRTAWLEAAGFRVERFWNNDVLANPDGVLERIREALEHPPPRPSPARGEGDLASPSRNVGEP